MKKIYVTKKYRKILDSLGYSGNETPAYDEVAEWLMEKHDYYVMPIPEPYWKWEVGIVIMGKPNTQDYLLNRCTVGESLKSIEKAVRVGVEFVLDSLYKGQKIALSGNLDVDSMVESLRKEGFDV